MNLNQSISVSVNSSDTPAAQYKTVILKPNIVSDVNTLTQSMMAQTNTKYVIKYDYTLGEDIRIPANCVLEFDGGSISASGSNDTITGTNTGINAGLVKIFNTNVTLAGTWNVAEAYPEWFGAVGDGVTDDAQAITKVCNYFKNIKFSNRNTYLINSPIVLDNLDNLYCCIKGRATIIKTNNVTAQVGTDDINAIFILNISVNISNIDLVGDVSNGVKGIVLASYTAHTHLENIHIQNCYDGVYTFGDPFQVELNRIHCRNCENGINLSNNAYKTSFTIMNCWMENCGQAYDFTRVNYFSLINCAADWANYVRDDNPYGQSHGSKKTEKGVYNFSACKNAGMYNCGAENCYGNGVIKCNSTLLIVDGLTAMNIKSEFEPNYSYMSNWAVGLISTTDSWNYLNISSVYGDFENIYVTQNYPSKIQAAIGLNYSVNAYGNPGKAMVLASNIIISGGATSTIFGGNAYKIDNSLCLYLDTLGNLNGKKVSTYLAFNNYFEYASKGISGNSNKLEIPFVSQGGKNIPAVVEVIGVDGENNSTNPKGFRVLFQVVSLTSLNANTKIIEKSNESITLDKNGMKVILTLPDTYKAMNVFVKIYVGTGLNMLDFDNIALQGS